MKRRCRRTNEMISASCSDMLDATIFASSFAKSPTSTFELMTSFKQLAVSTGAKLRLTPTDMTQKCSCRKESNMVREPQIFFPARNKSLIHLSSGNSDSGRYLRKACITHTFGKNCDGI